jgi:hypothetical protein
MVDFTKHVGRGPHGTRLVVVFREIPGAEDHCLCVESDSLTEMYHDQLMREVKGKDAQGTVDLFKVLERRYFGDGQQMLNGLHNKGLLRKMKVSEVTMVPMPNRTVPLELVNKQIKGEDTSDYEINSGDVVEVKEAVDNPVSVDTERGLAQAAIQPVQVNKVEVGTDAAKAAAEGKLLQARLMEEDAKKMREEAYALDPDLKKGGRPSKATKKKAEKAKAKSE